MELSRRLDMIAFNIHWSKKHGCAGFDICLGVTARLERRYLMNRKGSGPYGVSTSGAVPALICRVPQ